MKNKFLSFLLAALASSAYAQENAEPAVASSNQSTEIPVEQVAVLDEEGLDTLEDYQVTAYRFPTAQLDTPVNTTVITSKDIAESFSSNIADVLQKKANVTFNNSWSGGSAMASINMRGFAGSSNDVLVIIDGQRMNRADMGALNWQQIPLEYIDSIEVMRGSQSAMYGNNAMAGVIKITTKKGSTDDTYAANLSYGSYGTYNVNGLVTGSYENWSWSADVGRMYTDGYRDNAYEWTNSYNFSATNQISDAVSLRVGASYSQSEFGMAGAVYSWDEFYNSPTTTYSPDDYYAVEEGIYTIALNTNTNFGEGEVAFSASTRNIFSSMPSWGASYYYADNDQLSLNFTPKYKFNITDEAHVVVGLDAEYIDIDASVNADSYSWDYSYIYDYGDNANIQRYSIAPYIAGDMTVAEKFIFTAAARYEYTVTQGSCTGTNYFDEDMNSQGLAANVGVTYKIDDNSSVYFRFDQVYNYPSTDEIASYQGYSSSNPFNVNLDPEHGQNYEIGYKYMDKNWTANANVFLMYLEDEVYYDGITTWMNDNYADPTLRYGFEYQLAYDSKYWGASLMGTVMKAEFASGVYDGCDVPLVPNFTNTIAVYVKPIESLRLAMTLSYTSSSNLSGDYFDEYDDSPDYFLWGFVAEYKLAKNATLYFGIENILDEDYVSYGSAYTSYYTELPAYSLYPGMGRVIKAGVNLTF